MLNAVDSNLAAPLWQAEVAEINNPYRYCGEYRDSETGNYYLRARYYDPVTERMLSEDSVRCVILKMLNGQEIIEPLSLNLYAYCRNNPVRFCDPSGKTYVAAYLAYIQDIWKDKYPEIDGRSAILGTLYNLGVNANSPNSHPKPNVFGNYVKKIYSYMGKLLGLD